MDPLILNQVLPLSSMWPRLGCGMGLILLAPNCMHLNATEAGFPFHFNQWILSPVSSGVGLGLRLLSS